MFKIRLFDALNPDDNRPQRAARKLAAELKACNAQLVGSEAAHADALPYQVYAVGPVKRKQSSGRHAFVKRVRALMGEPGAGACWCAACNPARVVASDVPVEQTDPLQGLRSLWERAIERKPDVAREIERIGRQYSGPSAVRCGDRASP